MSRLIIALIIVLTALPAMAAEELKTDQQKTLYAIGMIMAKQLSVFNLNPAEFDVVKQGLADGIAGKPALDDLDSYNKKAQELAAARRDQQGEKLTALANEFVTKAVKEKGAMKTPSGMIYIPDREGKGNAPGPNDKVKVNYRGTFVDGKEFDNSYKRGQPIEFPLNGVIKCWSEGVQMIKPGGKARLICPPELAYGKAGYGLIPANATLVFDVELLDVLK